MDQVGIGIIGCGKISDAYIRAIRRFPLLELRAVADIVPQRAEAKALEHGVLRGVPVEELLADPAIEVVVNLTVPKAHAAVGKAAIAAGKHVYSEKPLATSREEGRELLEAAEGAGLRVGCAPDTFLGGGLQTCRKLVDDGAIGDVIGVSAFFAKRGLESWHPNPEFFFKPGAGPLFDMGPYYLTALVSLAGPVRALSATAAVSFPERVVPDGMPLAGQRIEVETPTHIAALLEFESGASGPMVTSFDVWYSELPRIEVYGSEGTLVVPDPNTFGGPVRLHRQGEGVSEVPSAFGYTDEFRGVGAADMVYALRSGRPHRASGDLAFHVLDVMETIFEAAEAGRRLEVSSRVERPAPFPRGLAEGEIDD